MLAFGLALAGSGLIAGFLMDRMPLRFLLAVSQGLMGVAMPAAIGISNPIAILLYGTALGGMQRMSRSIQSSVYAHCFGRLRIGAIRGATSTITIAGSASGPLLLAAGFDGAGAYGPVLTAAALVPLAIAAIAPFLRLRHEGRIR